MTDNEPISERYAKVGRAWALADYEASRLEKCRSARLAEHINAHSGLAHNKAEALVKGGTYWIEYNEEMVAKRRDANLLKVEMDALRMSHGEWQSQAANERLIAKM